MEESDGTERERERERGRGYKRMREGREGGNKEGVEREEGKGEDKHRWRRRKMPHFKLLS